MPDRKWVLAPARGFLIPLSACHSPRAPIPEEGAGLTGTRPWAGPFLVLGSWLHLPTSPRRWLCGSHFLEVEAEAWRHPGPRHRAGWTGLWPQSQAPLSTVASPSLPSLGSSSLKCVTEITAGCSVWHVASLWVARTASASPQKACGTGPEPANHGRLGGWRCHFLASEMTV